MLWLGDYIRLQVFFFLHLLYLSGETITYRYYYQTGLPWFKINLSYRTAYLVYYSHEWLLILLIWSQYKKQMNAILQKLLLSEKRTQAEDYKQRQSLKCLGSWLGIITLAKDIPILCSVFLFSYDRSKKWLYLGNCFEILVGFLRFVIKKYFTQWMFCFQNFDAFFSTASNAFLTDNN